MVENGFTTLKMSKSAPVPTVYAGEFRHAVDTKHRVTVPSRWRSDDDKEEFFAVPDPGGDFLMILPPHEFDRVKSDVEANASIAPSDRRKFIRRFYSLAQIVTVDKQGRILLPEEYCRRLGLEGEVVLIGTHSRMEIWNPQRWTEATAAEDEVFRRVAGDVGL
ncbi:MAG: division/cell wall cluster transcriptional repressor MraZ [Chthoniobacterales bacterium]